MTDIVKLVDNQRAYFATKETLDVSFRKAQLQRLYGAIQANETEIFQALKTDLNKSAFESYATEISMVYTELKYMIKHVEDFAKPQKRGTPIVHFPSSSRIQYDPYGCVLIMSPWNYPLQLCLAPLVGAMAAGNCVVVKPSNYSPATTKVIAKILSIFPDDYIAVVEGGRQENQTLLDQRFDFIFFTGGTKVAKLVMEKAAKHLTPVALELGGKSPCIVDETANIDLTAKRIVWGKLLNAGQTCVAPDYILVQEQVREKLVAGLHKYMEQCYGAHPETNPEYPKIINDAHFQRLSKLVGEGVVVNGETRQIAPVVMDGTTWDDEIMKDEIFGPILPVISYDTLDDIITKINSREKPLALYLFTTSKAVEKKVLKETFYGGGCVNDTVIHVANHHVPFGGVGYSGMGGYHGRDSFHQFSHTKSIVKKSNLLDINIRYAPFGKKLNLLRKIL